MAKALSVTIAAPKPPATDLAKKVDEALDAGASIRWVTRRYHLSRSELEDMDLAPDEADQDRSSTTGY